MDFIKSFINMSVNL